VLYLTLDETQGYFVDQSGQNNHGTAFGTLRYGPGKIGNAIGFDAATGYINTGSAASLNPPNAMTVATWVKPSGFDGTGTGQRTLIERRQYGSQDSYQLSLSPSGSATPGRIHFSVWTVNGQKSVDSVTTAPLNTWTHVTATYDGTMLRLYTNGVQEAQTAATGAITASSINTIIGTGNQGTINFYKGEMDEVRIYARALSAQETLDLARSATPPGCPTGGTATPTPSPTSTPTPTVSPSPSASASPTASVTPNPSASASPTASASPSASATPAATPSATPPPTGVFIPDKKCSTNLHFNFIRPSSGMRCWEGKVQYNVGSASWLLPFSSHKVKVNGGQYGVDDGCERIIVNGVTVVDRFGPCAQATGNMCLYAHGGSFSKQVDVIGSAVTMDIKYVDAFTCTCNQGNLWIESTVTYEAPQCAEQAGYTING